MKLSSNTGAKPPENPFHFLRSGQGTKDLKDKIEVVASKKVFKNAIKRNKARRRLKEAYRLSGQKGKPFVKINAKIGILKAPFNELKETIKKEINNTHV